MLKKYKIVESEFGGWSLHTRNNTFLVGLWMLPLVIADIVAMILLVDYPIFDLLSLFLWIGLTICLTGLAYSPYRYTKYFSTAEELHEYLAEEKLKSKPEIYYLDE